MSRPDADEASPSHFGEDDDRDIDLSDLRWDDGLVFLVFWMLAAVVFLQFFTRYVLNDSLGWTEEIARYLLIAVTFIGSILAVRKNSHIAVEVFYTRLPRPVRRVLQGFVDLVAISFYGSMAFICTKLAEKTSIKMVSIEVPKSLVYWLVAACFAVMAIYSVVLFVRHLRSGTSALIDPEAPAQTGPSLE